MVPAWVAPRNFSTDYRTTSLDYNVRLVRNANQTKALFDFAMWGDSLTANLLFDLQSAPVWDRYFSKAQAGWTSARLGVGGSTVEELTWRLMEGGEKFAIDPLVGGAGWGSRRLPQLGCGGHRRDTELRQLRQR